jgi:hypothetical protein
MSNFKFKNLACVLSSMLIFASVPYRVNSMGPGENQSASSLKSKILKAFDCSLGRWGARGDIHFWDYLRGHFSKMEINENYTSKDFESEICKVFEQISGGKKLEYGQTVYVESLDPGHGMSKGYVDGSCWIKEGIPTLKERIFGVSYLEVLSAPSTSLASVGLKLSPLLALFFVPKCVGIESGNQQIKRYWKIKVN